MQPIHTLHFSVIRNVFYNPPPQRKTPEEANLGNEGARKWVPFFLASDQETPCPERYEHNGISEVVHHLTGKLF
jgi:hypothetical protein